MKRGPSPFLVNSEPPLKIHKLGDDHPVNIVIATLKNFCTRKNIKGDSLTPAAIIEFFLTDGENLALPDKEAILNAGLDILKENRQAEEDLNKIFHPINAAPDHAISPQVEAMVDENDDGGALPKCIGDFVPTNPLQLFGFNQPARGRYNEEQIEDERKENGLSQSSFRNS